MKFVDYWYSLQRKNPELCKGDSSETKVILTVDNFKKQLEKAFLAGRNTSSDTETHSILERFLKR